MGATGSYAAGAPAPELRTEAVATSVQYTRFWSTGLTASAAWLMAAGVTIGWRDQTPWERTSLLGTIEAIFAVLLLLIALSSLVQSLPGRFRQMGSWLAALPLLLTAWEIVTAKLGLLPLPFFAPPQSVLEVFADDWRRLGESMIASLGLLAPGYFIGSAVGFAVGVPLGWSLALAYWVHPVLRFVGPLPAVAWLPLAFFFFHSTWSASTFLVAFATGFPVAVLTASGIASVNSEYYDLARTLGASQRFLIFKVAIPAAMPHVFVGLFMGLGASFAVLIVAEMLGVKAGFGYYLQWAQGWAAYANMYAALILMALLFSGLISLLFGVRNRLLAWQKGLVRW
ncbi:MAG: ABC transporter permease subunit [Bryobacteraceae bacterium]|jgi:NitT/TauT family transport system permease protein